MKHVLVTGCAGFIGSHTTEALLKKGFHVKGIDNFSDYYPTEQKEENINKIAHHDRFELVRGDLNTLDLTSLLTNMNYVIHLAAQPGVRKSWNDFGVYVKDNILATQRLLAACSAASIKKFVYASSSSVYGTASLPFQEEIVPRPMSPYGVTKLAAEHLCFAYQKSHALPVIALRYFTVYGPRQRPEMAFHRFIRSILEETPLTIFGDGKQTRDFTYVSDVVNANMLAMESKATGLYNIGGGNRISLNDVLSLLEELTGKRTIIRKQGTQKGDLIDTEADMNRAKKILEYVPKVSIRDGIRKEIEWVKRAGSSNEII